MQPDIPTKDHFARDLRSSFRYNGLPAMIGTPVLVNALGAGFVADVGTVINGSSSWLYQS